MFVDSVELF